MFGRSRITIFLVQLKRFDKQLASYHKAISLKPDYAEGYYNLGIAFNEALPNGRGPRKL